MLRTPSISGMFHIVVLSLLLCAPGWTTEPPVRILPLGDSLTYGETLTSTQGGYRNRLHTLRTSTGYNVDFVGTFSDTANPSLPDVNHQGWPGARTDQIHGAIAGWLDAIADPDIILLLIGTNDVWQNRPLNQIEDNLNDLIADIVTRRPFARIILSTLPERIDNAGWEADQVAFNAILPGLVSDHVALGRQITLVDMHPVLTPFDYSSDGVHPSTSGYEKMADTWLPAITAAISPRGSTNPPVIARIEPLVSPTQVTLVFSKPLADDAANPANFTISGGPTVSAATLDAPTKRSITLTTSPQAPGIVYTVSVTGIKDRTTQQNTIAPQSMANFTPSPITNGSFESDFAGWTPVGNQEIQSASPYLPTHGTKLLSFNSGDSLPNGSLSQTFPTTSGQTYQLDFDFGILSWSNFTQSVEVTVTGNNEHFSVEHSIEKQGAAAIRWLPKSHTFTADSTTTTLNFSDLSTATHSIDALLDNIRITPINTFTLAVTSSPFTGVPVTLSQSDISSHANGLTGLIRVYPVGSTLTVTAPILASGNDFLNWRKNGFDLPASANSISLTITGNISLEAVYQPSPPSATGYHQWLDSHNLTAGPTDDSDGDTIPNAIEFVLGGNPATQPDLGLLPIASAVHEDPDEDLTPSDYLLFTYRRSDTAADDPDTAIEVEWTTDPAGPWTPASTTPGVVTIPDDDLAGPGIDLVRAYLPTGLAPDGRLFARLKVVISPP